MNDKTYFEVWQEYCLLERELREFVEYVPLENEHLEVWSLKLGNILIILGSVLDSFFKFALEDPVFDEIPVIEDIRGKTRTDIDDYKTVFQDFYNLSEKRIYVRLNGEFLQPFKAFGEHKAPEWWQAYQSVKHDRFVNKKEAKLKYILEGIAGLFLVNVIHIPIRVILVHLRLWEDAFNKGWNWDFVADSILNQKEPISEWGIFLLKTDLFGYILEGNDQETIDPRTWKRLLGLVSEPLY